jgi:hypothetical protein
MRTGREDGLLASFYVALRQSIILLVPGQHHPEDVLA